MKKIYSLLTVSLLLAVLYSHAQNKAIDSIRSLLEKHSALDTTRVNLLNALALELLDIGSEESLKTSETAARLSRDIHFSSGEVRALRRIGSYYYQTGDYASALKAYDSNAQASIQAGDSSGLAWALNGKGTVFHSQSNYPQALQFYLQSVQTFEKIGKQNDAASIMGNVGVLYKEMGEPEQALNFYERGLKIHEQLGHKNEIARFLNNIGGIYQEQLKLDKAEEIFLRAFPLAESEKNAHLEGLILRNLSNVKDGQHKYRESLNDAFRALSFFETLNETEAIADVYYQIADTYFNSKKADSALYYGNKALAVADKIGFKRNIYNTYQILAYAYAEKKNYLKAYEAQKLYISYKDSLVGEDKKNLVAGLKFQYDLDKKQSEIAILTRDKELQEDKAYHQRLNIYALLAGLLLAGLLAVALIVNNRQKQKANRLLQQQRDHLAETLQELKATQAQLVQREKMASLGELTAGIAHEIQNPLNFVNNFSELSAELVDEMGNEFKAGNYEEGIALASNIRQNLEKIMHHGKRVDAIVRGMLQHSKASTGQTEPADINALADEYLKLSYHISRTREKGLQVTLKTNFDPALEKINVVPQDIGRVLLNIFNNAFYALAEKKKNVGESFEPFISVTTKKINDIVEIRIRDNGIGIPQKNLDKIFQPFFTTKPTGKGTGLGLSLSYDIITQGHRGILTVDTREGEYSEFIMELPV
ncbi:MAG: tetratricopeptide repeat protein [Bacteroidetes bacterium]|nr:tetratricopeptide repeat protein [Bacteroidota bacterium]